ncbi:ATP-binding protein, partial [Streptomyces sp. GC420]|uniref:ATP-binding protein n=1 Tax=Streptomyces sp. GC420 TaxID=2697568 RepID=UPI0028BE615A
MNQKSTRLSAPPRRFTVLLSPTRRGARLARLLASAHLREWDVPCEVTERAEHIVAELAANAAVHGRVLGRDFRLGLTVAGDGRTLRIEVADARHERIPGTHPHAPDPDSETGRGRVRGLPRVRRAQVPRKRLRRLWAACGAAGSRLTSGTAERGL